MSFLRLPASLRPLAILRRLRARAATAAVLFAAALLSAATLPAASLGQVLTPWGLYRPFPHRPAAQSVPPFAAPVPLLRSDFNKGVDGWTVSGMASLQWVPGDLFPEWWCLRGTPKAGVIQPFYYLAPKKFLGDRLASYLRAIGWRIRVTPAAAATGFVDGAFGPRELIVQGGIGGHSHTLGFDNPSNLLAAYLTDQGGVGGVGFSERPYQGASNIVLSQCVILDTIPDAPTQQEVLCTLANVSSLRIRGQYVTDARLGSELYSVSSSVTPGSAGPVMPESLVGDQSTPSKTGMDFGLVTPGQSRAGLLKLVNNGALPARAELAGTVPPNSRFTVSAVDSNLEPTTFHGVVPPKIDDETRPNSSAFIVTYTPGATPNPRGDSTVLRFLVYDLGGRARQLNYPLKGTGAVQKPALEIVDPKPPNPVNFGISPPPAPRTQSVRAAAAPLIITRTVLVRNNQATGPVTAKVGALPLPFASSFAGKTVKFHPGTSPIIISFTPRASDPKDREIKAELTLTTTTQPPVTLNVGLAGRVAGDGALVVTPSPLNFDTSQGLPVTRQVGLTNTTPQVMSATWKIVASGPVISAAARPLAAPVLAQAGTNALQGNFFLQPGQTAALDVKFTPDRTGEVKGELRFEMAFPPSLTAIPRAAVPISAINLASALEFNPVGGTTLSFGSWVLPVGPPPPSFPRTRLGPVVLVRNRSRHPITLNVIGVSRPGYSGIADLGYVLPEGGPEFTVPAGGTVEVPLVLLTMMSSSEEQNRTVETRWEGDLAISWNAYPGGPHTGGAAWPVVAILVTKVP